MRDEMSYKGNRLFCSQCKYYSKEEIINGQSIRKSCKNIDHNIIQLRPSIFGDMKSRIDLLIYAIIINRRHI